MNICQGCKKEFNKKPKDTWAYFATKKFCSRQCYWLQKEQPEWLNKGGGHHKGHKHSEESKRIMSEKSKGRIAWNKGKPSPIKGEKHPLWKGGSSLSDRIRSSYKNQEWIRQVFKRDGYKCTECGRKRCVGDRVILEADHILPLSYLLSHIKNNFAENIWYEVALEYQPLWDISNGRTLCQECHKKTPTYAGKALSFNTGF